MFENLLISPLRLRKAKNFVGVTILIAGMFVFFTFTIDTTIFTFNLRTQEMALYLYNFPRIGASFLLPLYDYILSDWVLNKIWQGLLFGSIISYFLNEKLSIKSSKTVLRGSTILNAKELKKSIKEKSRLTIGKSKVPIPYFDENRSFGLIGKSGAGKTQTIFNLLEQITTFKEMMIIYDRKPDFWISYFREDKDYLFYPADKRSLKWNLFDDISDNDKYKINEIDFMVKSIIPENPKASDPFWDNAARIILKAVFIKVKNSSKPSNKTLIDFIRTYREQEELWEELEEIEHKYGVPVQLILKEGSKTADSIMINLEPYYSKILKNEFYYTEGNFSIKKFIASVKDKNVDTRLFLVQTKKEDGYYESYFRLMIDMMTREIMSLPNNKNRRIWSFFDEFQTLGKLNEVIDLLAEARSKGNCSLLATQDLARVEEIYGEKLMRSIFNLLSTKIMMQYDEPKGQKFVSDFYGEQEVEEKTTNRMIGKEASRDVTQMQEKTQVKKILLAGELSNLKPLEAYVKISNYPIAKLNFKYLEPKILYQLEEDKYIPFDSVYEDEELEDDEMESENQNEEIKEDEEEESIKTDKEQKKEDEEMSNEAKTNFAVMEMMR